MELVDDFNDGNNDLIDILIGFDNYWNIVYGEMIWCEFGFIVISSKFGWFLFGLGGELIGNVIVFNFVIIGELVDYFFFMNEYD